MCHDFIRHLQITRKPIYQSAPCVSSFLQILLAGWGHQQKCAELSSVPLFAFSSHLIHFHQWSYWLVVVDFFPPFLSLHKQTLTSHLSQTQPYPRVWYLEQGTSSTATGTHWTLFQSQGVRLREKRKDEILISVSLLGVMANLFPHFSNDIANAENEVWHYVICKIWDRFKNVF